MPETELLFRTSISSPFSLCLCVRLAEENLREGSESFMSNPLMSGDTGKDAWLSVDDAVS